MLIRSVFKQQILNVRILAYYSNKSSLILLKVKTKIVVNIIYLTYCVLRKVVVIVNYIELDIYRNCL